MASIVDVATQANVAVSTVSLVINHRERVAPATRRRVERVIQQLGYTPRRRRRNGSSTTRSANARPAVKLAFVYTLEAIIDDSLGSYCRHIVTGVEEQARHSEATVSLFRGAAHADEDPIIHDLLRRRPYDGVILFGPEPENGYLERLVAADVPLVVFNRMSERQRYGCVTLDYFGGAKQAVEALVEMGHRRIAVPRSDSDKWLVQRKEAGTREAMADHGLEPIWLEVSASPHDHHTWASAACRATLDQGATALFTGDKLAVLCADQFEQWGVSVPEDMSVMGFDNLGLHTVRGRRLTSIAYDKRRMGRLAVRMARALIRAQGRVCSYAAAVPTRVSSKGQTVAPPPSGE